MVADAVRAAGEIAIVAFVSDRQDDLGRPLGGLVVTGPVEAAIRRFKSERAVFHVAIGDNGARRRYIDILSKAGMSLATIRHPSAWISPSAVLDPGVYVGPQASVNANTKIGEGVIINTGAIVEHECEIGACSHVAPGACVLGGCALEDGVFLGSRSTVIPMRRIHAGATVGAGAVVVRDVPAYSRVKGVPAR